MEESPEKQNNASDKDLDVVHEELGSKTYRFYLLRLKSLCSKQEWVKVGTSVSTIFSKKQRKSFPKGSIAQVARQACVEIANKFPNLLLVEGEGDAMKVRLTEEGKKATEQYATTHDLPNGTTRKKVKTELELLEEVRQLKKENEELRTKLVSLQDNFDKEKSALVENVKTLNDELVSIKQRASTERTMLQSQIDVLLSKVQVGEPGVTASYVQELLKENVELTKQANLDKAKIELLEERLKNFQVFDFDLGELPSCFDSWDFTPYLTKFNTSTGKRANMKGFNLEEVDTSKFKVPDLFKRFIEKENILRQCKQNLKDLDNEKTGKKGKNRSNRGAESASALRVFFRFVASTLNPEKMDLLYLFDERLVQAWTVFYSSQVSSPSSAGNYAKCIAQFFNHLQTLDQFQGYGARLQRLSEFLYRFRQQTKRQKEVMMASRFTEEALYILGQWLNESELTSLNADLYKRVLAAFDRDAEFLASKPEDELDSKLSIDEKIMLMDALLVLCFINLGGQRKEFVVGMTVENINFTEGNLVYYPPVEKVIRQKSTHFILPKHLAHPLRIWMERYLPSIKNDKVISVWVRSDGQFLNADQATDRVADTIEEFFPGRRITPMYFRRGIVTYLVKNALHADDPAAFKNWVEKHAALINTSPQVMNTHYNRYSMSKTNRESLDFVNSTMNLVPDQPCLDAMSVHIAAHEQNTEATKLIAIKVVDQKYDEISRLPSFKVRYENDAENWVPLNQMHGLGNLVDEFRAESKKSKKKKRSAKPKMKAPSTPSTPSIVKVVHPSNVDEDDDFQVPKPRLSSVVVTKPPVSPDKLATKLTSPAKAVPGLNDCNNDSGTTSSVLPTIDSTPMEINVTAPEPATVPTRRRFWNIFSGEIVDAGPPNKKPRISLSSNNNNNNNK